MSRGAFVKVDDVVEETGEGEGNVLVQIVRLERKVNGKQPLIFRWEKVDIFVKTIHAAQVADTKPPPPPLPVTIAAYSGQSLFAEAAQDGEKCVQLNPQFVKGYHRYALGLKGTKQYAKALEDLNKLINEIEPLLAKAEQARRLGLSPSELLKEQGNDLFKAASFEKAIEVYTEAINACEKDDSPVAISCYNNRAACHQQLSNFSAVIRDCSHVLEYDVSTLKANCLWSSMSVVA
ncbi:hypothetical protein AC1031_021357 [Aphanomyces cochlioides]|nr:hypothetical protein AC1031_021357 [Aphanomyces cochlioides]